MLAYFISGMCHDFLVGQTGGEESSRVILVRQSK
jgi:hypothetical protein